MKLFFLLLFFSVNTFAGYVAGSKINSCSRTDYSNPSVCSKNEKEDCYKVPDDSGECGVYKLKEIFGSIKHDEETCSGQSDCQDLLAEKVCGVGRYSLIDSSYSEVYCVEVLGKEIVVDEAAMAIKTSEKIAIAQYEKDISDMEKEINKGKRVVALFKVLSNKKNLSKAQRKQLLGNPNIKAIMDALSVGSLPIAAELIQNFVPDGVLVTDDDKIALLKELQ
jgi:hypothetical protein